MPGESDVEYERKTRIKDDSQGFWPRQLKRWACQIKITYTVGSISTDFGRGQRPTKI